MGGNDNGGQRMNRYATKVSDYGLIFCGWSRAERGLLCSNDGKSRLGKKQEAEGQMTERQADRRGSGGAKKKRAGRCMGLTGE